MCQREYLISRIFKLFLVLLNRANFPRIPRIPRISQVFQLLLRVTLIKQNLLLTYRVVLYQTNVMSLMVYSELRGHLDRMALVD